MEKQDGFKGQRSVIIPDFIIKELQEDTINKQLYITDIGFYPKAIFHQRLRKKGSLQYILIYCIDGKGWVSIDGIKMEVKPNQFFIIPKDTAHSYGSYNSDPWSIYWIHFSGKLAAEFTVQNQKVESILPSKIARIDERIMLFEEMLQNLEMGYSKENLHYANICLLHFLASFKYINQFRQIRKIRERDVIEDSIFFMKENIQKKLTLKELSRKAGLSPSHFSFKFYKKTGRSPMDYLIHLRIQRACQFLDNSELRIGEVSEKVGYEDNFYFSRIFKKIMGVSPVKYRKQPKG